MSNNKTSKLNHCTKCGLPETYETIEFDEQGICNICRQQDFKKEKINWKSRKKMLDSLIEKYRGKYDYDCIIPFSGGKDSTFTLYYLIKEYNIKPAGLMCIPPLKEAASPHFWLLKKLTEEYGMEVTSMGMSNDFEVAIEMGSTHVRVGSALFGSRI